MEQKMFVKVASALPRGNVSPSAFVVTCGKVEVVPRCVEGCVRTCVREENRGREGRKEASAACDGNVAERDFSSFMSS